MKDPIEMMAKMMYLGFNMDMIKENPDYWELLPEKKQRELHEIKKELDEYFKEHFPNES